MATETALAKINLALHVTGRRADGYHLLDSLVAFAGIGDRITAEPADALSLTVVGPMAGGLSHGPDNLVLRAARLMGPQGARLELSKELPVASGIGGGSADAAATLRLLAALWRRPLPAAEAILSLGADVPVCLAGRPTRMSGVGERLGPLAHPLPPAWLVLANPGLGLSTPAVFAALTSRDNPPLPAMPPLADARALAGYLSTCRNDLEPPAQSLAPTISAVLAALQAQPGCLLARMSGSGATCFGLFEGELPAEVAARAIAGAEPGWWVRAAPLLTGA